MHGGGRVHGGGKGAWRREGCMEEEGLYHKLNRSEEPTYSNF